MDDMIYLASPYSHPDPAVVEKRYLSVCAVAAALINRGLFVWSPIAQTHPTCIVHKMPTDAVFWKAYNFDFMRRADAIYVLAIDGWRESKGVMMEIDFADYNGMTLQFVNGVGELIDRPS
jgi:hypothetical protein